MQRRKEHPEDPRAGNTTETPLEDEDESVAPEKKPGPGGHRSSESTGDQEGDPSTLLSPLSPAGAGFPSAGKDLKVLLVDDNPVNLQVSR